MGGRSDLPVPLSYFLIGAGVVLVVSFAALAVLWPEPRLQDGPRSRPVHVPGARALAAVLRVLGVASLVLVLIAGLGGRDLGPRNAAPVFVWILFWLVVPFAGAVAGNLYTPLNPWRTLSEAVGLGEDERPDLLQRWGIWPATIGFVAFTWLELVSPTSASPRTIGVAALVFTVVVLAAVAASGRDSGLQMVDPFTTYNRLLSSISPLGRDASGELRWRGWLRALPLLPQWRGITLFVVAMIGTVTYDGLSNTPWWRDRMEALFGSSASSQWVGTLGLLGIVALIGGAYYVASWGAVRLAVAEPVRVGAVDAPGAARDAGSGVALHTAGSIARSFAHTLVPIALAYAFAHYFTLVIFEGQLLMPALSDPLGQGWDLFGTADWSVSFWLAPTAVWYIQVAAIVGGHVLGVVLAHDRALHLFPATMAVRSQYAMLLLMVALTGLGLTILAAG